MKLKPWALLKIALIVFLATGVVAYRVESEEDAWHFPLFFAIVFSFLALFQLAFWLVYDVMTLKRGQWGVTTFSDNPFARKLGPGINLTVPAISLLAFGAAKIVAAIFQGLPSLVISTALLTFGALLLAWQAMLRKLFRSRFAQGQLHREKLKMP